MAGFKSVCRQLSCNFKIIFSILMLTLCPSASSALDYKITEVIEVGEADFVPFLNPVIWSPDGTKIAFTKSGVIYVSDTLGNVQEVIRPETPLHRWDWVSDSQIGVYSRKYSGQGRNTINRLSTIEVNLKKEMPLHDYTTFYGYRKVEGNSIYTGPFKSVEGNSFYSETQYSTNRGKEVFIQHAFDKTKASTIENDHFLRWSDSGLYMVQINGEDSIWLTQKPYQQMSLNPIVSADLKFAFDRRVLFKLKDASYSSINSFFDTLPANTVQCGVVWASFNSVAPELLFTISCDDGENYVTNRIATFDCQTMRLNVIDTDLNISNCAAATFAPDGRRIAFLANDKVYVSKREIK